MIEHLTTRYLADHLGLRLAQGQILFALSEWPLLDARSCEQLGIYPRGKIRSKVLADLEEQGWVCVYSKQVSGKSGAPSQVWSVNPEKRAELNLLLKQMESKAQKTYREVGNHLVALTR
jgi:hypothetical protein